MDTRQAARTALPEAPERAPCPVVERRAERRAPASSPAPCPAAPAPEPRGAGGEGGAAPTPHSTMIPEPREFEVHGAARALLLKFRVLAKCQGRRDARGRLWASAEKIAAAAGLEAGLVRGRLVAGVPDLLPRGASWIAVSTVLPQGVVGRVAGGGEEVFARAPAGMKIAPGDELAASKSSFGGWICHEI